PSQSTMAQNLGGHLPTGAPGHGAELLLGTCTVVSAAGESMLIVEGRTASWLRASISGFPGSSTPLFTACRAEPEKSPPQKVPKTCRWRTSACACCLDPMRKSSRRVVAKFRVSQLMPQRAKDFSLVLDDAAIKELSLALSFSQECAPAVGAKKVAYQEAQLTQFLVEKVKQKQWKKILQAEGEAEAAKKPGYIKCLKTRATQKVS
ncbi:Hypothetical predicted protein, partial [Marmota monax]